MMESVQRASEQAEETGRDLERAAEEMERTALLFQNDLPLTMREVQKASEEFELVGKQLNVVFNSVTRPLREPVVEKALSSRDEGGGEVDGPLFTADCQGDDERGE